MSFTPLNVVIANERLLPRFGVDRLLLLLGAGLRARGHRVTFVCVRGDPDVALRITPRFHVLPELGKLDLHGAEQAASKWFDHHWEELRSLDSETIVVSGGWPFFSLASVGEKLTIATLFIDAGAVPQGGMSVEGAHVQRELRRVRARELPRFSAVLPISDFIRNSQTLPDRGTDRGVTTVLLGADHLDTPMFSQAEAGNNDSRALSAVGDMTARGLKPVVLLGRFESQGYKNSPAAFDVLSLMLQSEPNVRLLCLARPGELTPPEAIRHAVIELGFVSDEALDSIMRSCELGLSVSLWEGFNLPLAEMQWRGRPVLAFSVGAHPEVTVDPWFLCDSVSEMARKAVSILASGVPPHVVATERFERFRSRFKWADVIARYTSVIETLRAEASHRRRSLSRLVVVDCSSAAQDPANPGVIRVVRRACHAMQTHEHVTLVFARWDARHETYRFLTADEQRFLSSYDGPRDGFGLLFSEAGQGSDWPIDNVLAATRYGSDAVLFLPEVILDSKFPERLAWAASRGLVVAALLYDLIPVTHSPFCAPEVVRRFVEYLEALACVDALWAISGESLTQFERYAVRRGLPMPPSREAVWLPGQFSAQPRVSDCERESDVDPLVVLCVGSIEPRKNHRTLITAFRSLLARRPDLSIRLVLIGHRFAEADDLAEWLNGVMREEPRIVWRGLLPDAEVAATYRRAAFSVYPSLVEGFGLPIMESLWMGRPCLCHSGGVMAELASQGGCLTADMNDPAALEHAIETLADDSDLRERLACEARGREIDNWDTYAGKLADRLAEVKRGRALVLNPEARSSTRSSSQRVPDRATVGARLRGRPHLPAEIEEFLRQPI